MAFCYFIQNHLGPQYAARLISRLRSGSSDPHFLVAHDPYAGHCETSEMRRALDDVDLFEVSERPKRGYFSLLQPYFDAVRRLSEKGVRYDWIVYLSSQDYPTQPLRHFERMLATSGYDGFLSYWDARAIMNPWGRRKQGIHRYYYQYYDAPEWLALFLRRLNRYQPIMQTHLVFGPRVGFRLSRSPFTSDYVPYSGKQWTCLKRECAEHITEAVVRESPVVQWFRRTICPDEAVAQTLLLNERHFRLMNDDLRYVDFSQSRDGHPRVLTLTDLPVISEDSIFFARKFDPRVDARILDALDERIGHSRS